MLSTGVALPTAPFSCYLNLVALREDLVPWSFIFFGGIITAIVCFRILDSTAETESGIPLTGAIVGALVSWSALSNVFLQLRRSNRTTESFHDLVDKLQNKVVRSSPLPVGYEREVDERHGLVLARPEGWKPRGGVLFSFSAPPSTTNDIFSAELQITHSPVSSDESQESFYGEIRRSVSAFVRDVDGVHVEETVYVGGTADQSGIRSAKFTIQTYAVVHLVPGTGPGESGRSWSYLSKGQVREVVASLTDRALRDAGITPRGAQYLEQFALIRREVKVAVDLEIDSWRIDPGGGLSHTVRDTVDALLATNRDRFSGLPDQESATGTEQSSIGDASNALGNLQTSQSDDREQVDVVPVIRMLVASYYPNLHRAFLFDFVDNVGDFATSTALFNDVLGTVRYLE